MDDDEHISEVTTKPRFAWLWPLVVAAWLALWTIANIRTVQAEVMIIRDLDIDAITECQMLNATKPGTYVWHFEYGCQLKIDRRQK